MENQQLWAVLQKKNEAEDCSRNMHVNNKKESFPIYCFKALEREFFSMLRLNNTYIHTKMMSYGFTISVPQ